MKEILSKFRLESTPVSCERYGNGHINETYLVVCDDGRKYILQKINHNIFKRPDLLMENVAAVCAHISSKVNDPREAMTVIKTVDGKNFCNDENGCYWRVYDFITGSICLEKVEKESDFYESAYGFGMFQRSLADFDASKLHETIVDFHNTPDRYRKFRKAIEEDKCGRVKDVLPEIKFALDREADAHVCVDALAKGEIPLRVTHNDTKLNNVLLDEKTGKALCVIDLDTVMPGLSVNDFGDSIRFGASSAAEDERDLSKVNFVPSLYKTYAEGFLAACGKSLTENEIKLLPWGAKLMTLECGVRFLTDYIEGDVYFRIKSPDHNLVRTRTQFKLVADMEEKWDEMYSILNGIKY